MPWTAPTQVLAPTEASTWPIGAPRAPFERVSSLTVGLEEELILLDPVTLEPADDAETLVGRLIDDRAVSCEFRAAQLELITDPHEFASDAADDLAASRGRVLRAADGDVRIAGVGTHPFSTRPIRITDLERYRTIAADCPWATRRGLPSGLHVHVAVNGPERALAVYNAARSYLPEIAALGANSPYFEGRDSGLASVRLKLVEELSRAGVPPHFAGWSAFEDFVAWGRRGGAFADASYLWWDLRLNARCGTIEFRIADAQTTTADTGALAAVCQTLVAALVEQYDAGDVLRVHDSHRIAENRARALRDGLYGRMLDLETGQAVSSSDQIATLLVSLEQYGERLGCRNELLGAWSLLAENGAERQRELASWEGPVRLTRWLADETERCAPLGCA